MDEVIRLNLGDPQPKQREFLGLKTKYSFFGGGRGGGKSWLVDFMAKLFCLYYAGIKVLLVRRSYPELMENHIKPLREQTKDVARYNDKDKTLTFLNGSYIKFLYCSNEADLLNFQGLQFDVIFLDEAGQLTESMFDAIKITCRGVNNFPKRVFLTGNPGGVGQGWLRRLFIEKDYSPYETPTDYGFVQSTAEDNPALLESTPDYLQQLESLPEDLKRAWRYGDWYAFEGSFFQIKEGIQIVDAVEIQPWWKRYRAFDYGLDALAVVWVAVDDLGNEYVYRDYQQSNLVISSAAEKIKQLSYGEEYESTFAPPDMWSRTKDTGKTIAEVFEDCGVRLTKSNNDRVAGWTLLKESLKTIEGLDGQPTSRLKIFSNCKTLIKNMQLADYSATKPNDMATEPHEITHICVPGDTLIRTENGLERIDSMTSGRCYAYENGKAVLKHYDSVTMTSPCAEVYEVLLDDGAVIRATANHKVLTASGWKALKDLTEEDEVMQID